MERMNYRSTDSNGGFQCYMSNAATTYLNQDCVRKALHIPDYVQPWQICRKASDFHYHKIYNSNTSVDLTPVFQDIINSDYVQNNSNPFRILIYNGDVDLASGFLQAEYFVKNLVDMNSNVKGAGHMVPIDKPGPALQMFYNFIQKTGNYDTPLPQQLKRETLEPEFKPPPILANSRNTSTSGTTINILTSTPETTNNILITSTYETTINTSTISTSEPMINTSITSTSETKTNSSTFSTKEPMTSPNCAYMHTNGLNGLMALLLLKIFI
uniref:Uncharacterized protein n=1 Tax=Acrobeloides nanus TaxID=290746 RepID=A0A914DY95_9BILA